MLQYLRLRRVSTQRRHFRPDSDPKTSNIIEAKGSKNHEQRLAGSPVPPVRVFRNSSTGVSQFIDPHGHVHLDIEPMIKGAATSTIHRATHTTFFVRVGWLLPWINLVAFCTLMAIAVLKQFASKQTAVGKIRGQGN